jgi:hypothetical protein
MEESRLSRNKLQFQNKLRQLSTEKQRVAELERLVFLIKFRNMFFGWTTHCSMKSKMLQFLTPTEYLFSCPSM